MNDDNHTSHYITLKRRRDTAGISRSRPISRREPALAVLRETNIYQVRYAGAREWVCLESPDDDAYEWLYFDAKGVPSLYWNVTLPGLLML